MNAIWYDLSLLMGITILKFFNWNLILSKSLTVNLFAFSVIQLTEPFLFYFHFFSVWFSTVQMDWTTKPWASFSKDLRSQGPGLALMNLTGLNWRLVSLCLVWAILWSSMSKRRVKLFNFFIMSHSPCLFLHAFIAPNSFIFLFSGLVSRSSADLDNPASGNGTSR